MDEPKGTYATDRAWSDRFEEAIGVALRTVTAQHTVIRRSTRFEDTQHAADLMVLRTPDRAIACRMRRNDQLQYRGEFTIRSRRDTGEKTEAYKIFDEGWGDWFFYGFEHDPGTLIIDPWLVVDLHAMRKLYADKEHWQKLKNDRTMEEKANGDGTYFWAFKAFYMPPGVVLKRHEPDVKAPFVIAPFTKEPTAAEKKAAEKAEHDAKTASFLDLAKPKKKTG
jgi:hypothetical protein